MTKRVLAVIPARGGSKGLPKKNIKNLCGKPLIAWTIEASLKSEYILKTIVSSDDESILNIAKEYGADTVLRPEHLATDTALSVPVVSHVLSSLKESIADYEYVALLQPTSPLRAAHHIDQAFSQLLGEGATSVISVVNADSCQLKSFLMQDGYLKGIVNDEYPFMRRQDLPKTYHANGAIYIVNINEFLKHKTLLTSKTIPFEMDELSSIDIDTYKDLDKAKDAFHFLSTK